MRSLALAAVVATSFFTPSFARWVMTCPNRLVRQRADPVVTPGKVSGHVHTIVGGNGFDFQMDYDQALASECSSCPIKEDLSNYWTPQLYFQAPNGSFFPVPQKNNPEDTAGGQTIYYLQRGKGDEKLTAFPKDFRMVAGDPFKRSPTIDPETGKPDFPTQGVSYACLGTDGPETNGFPTKDCPGGLRAQVFFPSCWDGKNLDSEDHRSHVSYPAPGQQYNSGSCPESHPVHLISIFFEVLYETNFFLGEFPKLSLASSNNGGKHGFVFANGDNSGYGFHGDFVNGWDIDVLQSAIDECTADDGGTDLCQHFGPKFTREEMNACRLPQQVEGDIVDGWVNELPGCNPVTGEGKRAAPPASCDAPSAIVANANPDFVDLTSNGWSYAGCGTDGSTRTFPDETTSNDNMTAQACTDHCSAQNFKYAGLEFGRECFCGNDLPQDRAPKAGIMGGCAMDCAGDTSQKCGGAKALSIYEKCDGDCKNAELKKRKRWVNSAAGDALDTVKRQLQRRRTSSTMF